MDYNKKLDELFVKWQNRSNEKSNKIITRDGLLKKKDADVNELWAASNKRVMFLLKDQPNSEGDDIRNWLVLDESDPNAAKNINLKPKFLKNLGWIFYAIMHDKLEYWNIQEKDVVECFNTLPFALVETKKQSGASSIEDSLLDQYIEEYKDLLKEEIEILNPNIIVCCGGPQHHFALNILYEGKEMEEISSNVHYIPSEKILILYAAHPSARGSYQEYFEGIVYQYEKFLKKYPNLFNEK